MKARLDGWLRRLGLAGVLGLGVLLACAGFYADALAPIETELAAQRLAQQRLRARTPYGPIPVDDRAEALRRFHLLFPPSAALIRELEQLHQLARTAGLELAQGEYRLDRRGAGLWAYRATLPVRGTYSQLRAFVSGVLKEMPTASIDALRFERKKAAETELDAQVGVTLYLRPAGGPE